MSSSYSSIISQIDIIKVFFSLTYKKLGRKRCKKMVNPNPDVDEY